MQIELQLQAVGANNNESVDEGCLPAIEWMLQQVRLICATINQSITLSGNQSISQCDASITALGDGSLLITPQVQWNSGNPFGFQLEIEMEMEIEMETQWDSKLIVLNIYIQIYPGVSSIIALVSVHLQLRVPLSLSLLLCLSLWQLSAMITQIATVSIFRLSPFARLVDRLGWGLTSYYYQTTTICY